MHFKLKHQTDKPKKSENNEGTRSDRGSRNRTENPCPCPKSTMQLAVYRAGERVEKPQSGLRIGASIVKTPRKPHTGAASCDAALGARVVGETGRRRTAFAAVPDG
jgi:hypothetical protein